MSSKRGENEILRDHKNVGYHVGRVKTLALKRTKTKSSTKKQTSSRCDFHPPSNDHQRLVYNSLIGNLSFVVQFKGSLCVCIHFILKTLLYCCGTL